MLLSLDEMELLEQLRKKLDLVEAYFWFAENGIEGLCCPNAIKAKAKFEARDSEEVFFLIKTLHERKGKDV